VYTILSESFSANIPLAPERNFTHASVLKGKLAYSVFPERHFTHSLVLEVNFICPFVLERIIIHLLGLEKKINLSLVPGAKLCTHPIVLEKKLTYLLVFEGYNLYIPK
jgi:hypothetical protein